MIQAVHNIGNRDKYYVIGVWAPLVVVRKEWVLMSLSKD